MPSDDIQATIGVQGADQAVKDIQKVEKEGDKLSKQKITPKVGAPADIAAKIQEAVEALKAFADEGRKADVAARALGDAFADMGRKGLNTEELVAGLRGLNIPLDDIASHAKGVAAQLSQLSDEELRALESVTGKRGAAAAEMKAGFEEAHEAIAGVVGDTTGELLAMGGAAEQVTVPVAQLAEQIANLALKGGGIEGLGGLLKAAGPIAAITAAVGLATAAWESYKRKQEEVAKATEAAAEKLGEITGVTEELDRALKEAATGPGATIGEQLVFSLRGAEDNFNSVLSASAKLNLEWTDLGNTIAAFGRKGTGDFEGLVANMQQQLGLTQEEAAKVAEALDRSGGNMASFLDLITKGFTSANGAVLNIQKPLAVFDQQQVEALKAKLALYIAIRNAATGADIEDEAKKQLEGITSTTEGVKKMQDAIKELNKQGIVNPSNIQILIQMGAILDDNADKAEKAALALQQWHLQNRDIATELPRQWDIAKIAADKYRRGLELTGIEQQTLNALASQMGIDVPAVLAKAASAYDAETEAIKRNRQAQIDAAEARRKAVAQQEEDNNRLVESLFSAQAALDDLASPFNQMAAAGDAMKSAFDLGNAPVDFLGRIRDIDDGVRDLANFINDPKKGLAGKIPNIFDPNDVHAGDFLQKISSLRGPIQQEIINAFSTGGVPAAEKTANQYVDELFAVLKGKLSKDQIRALFDIGDLEVKLKVAIDQKAKAEVENELRILTGLQGGETPLTASIGLALAAGTLSPQAAKILVEKELGKDGVLVPSTLATPDVGKAKSEADVFARQTSNLVDMLATVGLGKDKVLLARDAGQRYADDAPPIVYPSSVATPTPVKVPVEFIPQNNQLFRNGRITAQIRDAGGTVTSGIGLVAERRPEIINERFLVTEPTLVPRGTRVTSGARTAHILRTRGTRGLRRYDAGGTVMASPVQVNLSISGAALGARYDIMRTVRRAAKDAGRLLGTRS